MAKSRGNMYWSNTFFEEIGKSAGLTSFTKGVAEQIMTNAQASAPVDTGDYAAAFELVMHNGKDRNVWIVRNNDWKALLIEAKTGNLARAMKGVKR